MPNQTKTYDSRGRLTDKRHISERPGSVETRKYKGHWEIDTVMGRGSTDCIVTINERKTGFVMIGKLKDRSTRSLNKKTKRLISRDPLCFKTITADNGTEFHQYKKVESATQVRFYFANPFHSWERGSNENVNSIPKCNSTTLNERQAAVASIAAWFLLAYRKHGISTFRKQILIFFRVIDSPRETSGHNLARILGTRCAMTTRYQSTGPS